MNLQLPLVSKGRSFFVLLATLISCLPAHGLAPSTALKQAQHTLWSPQDGAPNRIVDLAQTSDGFLWIASQMGLYRFDGQRFLRREFPGDRNASWDVTALTATDNGELWVGSRRLGIVHFRAEVAVESFGPEQGIARSTVYSIRKDSRGDLWEASSAGVFHLQARHWQRVWPAANAESRPAANLWMARDGALCFTTDGAVLCKGAGALAFTPVLTGPVEDLALAPDGRLWVWLAGKGMMPLDPASTKLQVPSEIAHGHMVFSRSGDLFVLTYGHGLTHFIASPSGFTREEYGLQDGLQSSFLGALLEDREGNVWLGSTKGLERFRNGKFVSVPALGASPSTTLLPAAGHQVWAGLRTEPLGFVSSRNERTEFKPVIPGVTSAFEDHDGSAWFGASPFVWHVANGKAMPLRVPDFVQGSSDIQAIAKDRDGDLWVSVIRFGVLRFSHGTWTRFVPAGGTPDESATMLASDDEGRLWLSYHGRLVSFDGKSQHNFTASDAFELGDAMSLASRGSLVLVGAERGLALYANGRFRRVMTDKQEDTRNVSGMVFSADCALWLHATSALLRIAPEELAAFAAGSLPRVHARSFGFADGLPGLAPLVRPLPSAVLSDDGKIWVSTTSGVAWIDPLHYPTNPVAPSVVLESLQADGRIYGVADAVRLPALTRAISITYTAPSLSIAGGVRFRYRLDGFDSDWQDAGDRKVASYTGLAPGQYRFHVMAANEDGVWSDVTANTNFTVAPAFYQTRTFKVACWMIAALALWLTYRTRVHIATERVRGLLAERLAERERIAAELHDTLLQSVQGLILLFHGIAVQIPETDPISERIDLALGRAELLLAEGRDSVRDLRASTFSLADAFRSMEQEFAGRSTQLVVTVRGEQPELQLLVCDEVFKLGREAVRNAMQHARARTIEVMLSFRAHALELVVRDDGVGMSDEILRTGKPDHWGLRGMRERARRLQATLSLRSAPGQGTELQLRLSASMAYRAADPTLRGLLGTYGRRVRAWLTARGDTGTSAS